MVFVAENAASGFTRTRKCAIKSQAIQTVDRAEEWDQNAMSQDVLTEATPRQRMSQKRRHHIFTDHCISHQVAPCVVCGKPVHRFNDRWIIEHVRPLGLLGRDVNTNCGPAHYECGMVKTVTQDMPRIRKARRQAMAGRKVGSGFRKPAGAVYDWSRRKYVFAEDSPK